MNIYKLEINQFLHKKKCSSNTKDDIFIIIIITIIINCCYSYCYHFCVYRMESVVCMCVVCIGLYMMHTFLHASWTEEAIMWSCFINLRFMLLIQNSSWARKSTADQKVLLISWSTPPTALSLQESVQSTPPSAMISRRVYRLHFPQRWASTGECTDTPSPWTWVLGYYGPRVYGASVLLTALSPELSPTV